MLTVENTVLVLLAAGHSSRFGDIGNKLDQDFLGRPLGLHVAVALEDMPFKDRIAVVDGSALDYGRHGFRTVKNDDPDVGMARSVCLGVQEAERLQADAVLIALADMPRVTAAHIYRMFDAAEDDMSVIASSDGADTKPPALFGRGQFPCLKELEGDTGARALIRAGRHVVTAPAELIDVDTPEELERLRALVRSREAITRAESRVVGS